MYCPSCGKTIADDSCFCQHCGKAQQTEPEPTTKAESPEEIQSEPPNEKAEFLAPPHLASNTTFRKWLIIGIGLFLLFLIVTASQRTGKSQPPNSPMNDAVVAATDQSTSDAENAADAALADAAVAAGGVIDAGGWNYSTDIDKVRGGASYFATTTSTNHIFQNPPYDGETTLKMTVRKSPAYGDDVILTLSSGQVMCRSYEQCYGTVRFDSGPAHRVSMIGASDNSSDTVFVVNDVSFIRELKKAKAAIIEIEIYQAGRPQFEFDVSGLKWEH